MATTTKAKAPPKFIPYDDDEKVKVAPRPSTPAPAPASVPAVATPSQTVPSPTAPRAATPPKFIPYNVVPPPAPARGVAPSAITPGNIDLKKRPIVKNADGSISTVRSKSFGFDGREVLLPTVSDDGRIMSDEEAVATYKKTGRHLGVFSDPDSATKYAEQLHADQEKLYARPSVRARAARAMRRLDPTLTGPDEARRRAQADEPLVQSGLRTGSDAEQLASYLTDFGEGVVKGTASMVGLGVDALRLASPGALYRHAAGETMKATTAINAVVDRGSHAFREATGTEGVQIGPMGSVAEFIGELVAPGPEILAGWRASAKAGTLTSEKVIGFYEKKIAETADVAMKKVFAEERDRMVTALAGRASDVPVPVAPPEDVVMPLLDGFVRRSEQAVPTVVAHSGQTVGEGLTREVGNVPPELAQVHDGAEMNLPEGSARPEPGPSQLPAPPERATTTEPIVARGEEQRVAEAPIAAEQRVAPRRSTKSFDEMTPEEVRAEAEYLRSDNENLWFDSRHGLKTFRHYDPVAMEGKAHVYMDVQGMSKLNSAIGETETDKILKTIGELTKKHELDAMVKNAVVGDEMLSVVDDADLPAFTERFNNFKRELATQRFAMPDIDGNQIVITNIGVHHTTLEQGSVARSFKQADTDLYTAKAATKAGAYEPFRIEQSEAATVAVAGDRRAGPSDRGSDRGAGAAGSNPPWGRGDGAGAVESPPSAGQVAPPRNIGPLVEQRAADSATPATPPRVDATNTAPAGQGSATMHLSESARELPAPMGMDAPTAPPVAPPPRKVTSPVDNPRQFTTSNKNAVVDAERVERGLAPMMDLERQGNQAAWDEAMRVADENPHAQDELIAELTKQPRAVTPTENALLLHRRVELRNEHMKALERWQEVFESGDVERVAAESERVKTWSTKLAELEDITKATGSESGRSLQARKMEAREDFSLAAMEVRTMEAKGRHLAPDERVQLIAAQKEIVDLQRQIDVLEGGRIAQEVEHQTTNAMVDVRQMKPGSVADVTEDALVGRITAKLAKGDGQSITPLVQKLARKLWERGVRTQEAMVDGLHTILKEIDPSFTRDQTQRAFSGYGDFKPLSKADIDVGLRDLKGQTQQVLKVEALEARKPLEKTGVERRVPSDTERRLIKQVNELKRRYGVVTTDPATQLKSALQSRKTYYEHRISDLTHEIETRQRTVATKSPSPRDADLDALIAEKDRLQVEHDAIFPKKEMSDEQLLSQALRTAEQNRGQWEARLADAEKGVFNQRVPGRKVTSPELEQIRAQTEAIRAHVQELYDIANPKLTPEQRALKALKTRMAKQTADYNTRLAEGDFTVRARRPTPLDTHATELKVQRDIAKDAFQAGLERDRWAKSSGWDKTMTRAGGVYDLLKTVMSTGEFSFVLRQGKLNFFEALTSPRRMAAFGRSMREGYRSFKSVRAQRAFEIEMVADPLYAQALQHRLYVPEHASRLSTQEEFALGRYSDVIPGVQSFNRAGESFLKRLRFENYKIMVKNMTETGSVTMEEGKIIAAFINEQTGRGGLGVAEPAAVALNRVLFSPRYLASRLEIASGHQIWAGKWAGTGRARKAVAQSYGRMLVGAAAYYSALMLFFNRDGDDKAKLGFDFRSSDGGKLVMGDTRLDPMAGISQVMVMGQRTITGETLDADGEVVPIVGEDVPYGRDQWVGYAARFARSKLHPAVGMGVDLVPGFGRRLLEGDTVFKGENMVGESKTLTSKLAESGPMTYYDIYEALREQNLTDGVALSMLAMLGDGLQTYGNNDDEVDVEDTDTRGGELDATANGTE